MNVIEEDLAIILESLAEELQTMAGKRLLITGGAGFLGYYLVQTITAFNRKSEPCDQIELEVWDNYQRGLPDWLKAAEEKDSVILRKHDISQPLPQDIGLFSHIIHAASIASPIYYRKYPIETMDANVQGLRYLLEYAREKKLQGNPIEGFLFFSTSEIYGDPHPDYIPTEETYRGNVSCTGPRACYDESKRYGETLCVNFSQQHGLPIKIARPFNNYGPGLKITDGRVLPDFCRNVLHSEDIVMLSDGAPTRTFCYITDAIAGYYKILVRGRAGEPYNIGVETPEISIAQLSDLVVSCAHELFGYQGQVIRQSSRDQHYLTDNPNRRCPNIQKARSELGYDPKISLEEGLRKTLLWYKDNLEAEES